MSLTATNPQLTDGQRQHLDQLIQSYEASGHDGMIPQKARVELLQAIDKLVQQTGLMPIIKRLNHHCRHRGFHDFWPVLSAFIESKLVDILQTGVGRAGVEPPSDEPSLRKIEQRLEESLAEFLTEQPPNDDGSVTLTLHHTPLSVPSWEMNLLHQKQAICPDC